MKPAFQGVGRVLVGSAQCNDEVYTDPREQKIPYRKFGHHGVDEVFLGCRWGSKMNVTGPYTRRRGFNSGVWEKTHGK
jgi:hypothetical protein